MTTIFDMEDFTSHSISDDLPIFSCDCARGKLCYPDVAWFDCGQSRFVVVAVDGRELTEMDNVGYSESLVKLARKRWLSDDLMHKLDAMEQAIERHKALIKRPVQADLDLWSVIDSKVEPR